MASNCVQFDERNVTNNMNKIEYARTNQINMDIGHTSRYDVMAFGQYNRTIQILKLYRFSFRVHVESLRVSVLPASVNADV